MGAWPRLPSLSRSPSRTTLRLSNLDGVGVYRKVNGRDFLLHKGFSSAYYSTIRPALLERLAAIRATGLANARTVYLHGHSRGAAHAMLAAVDLATDSKAALNITQPFRQIKLYNFGSSRVGDKAYAQMTESLIGERFRIANRWGLGQGLGGG